MKKNALALFWCGCLVLLSSCVEKGDGFHREQIDDVFEIDLNAPSEFITCDTEFCDFETPMVYIEFRLVAVSEAETAKIKKRVGTQGRFVDITSQSEITAILNDPQILVLNCASVRTASGCEGITSNTSSIYLPENFSDSIKINGDETRVTLDNGKIPVFGEATELGLVFCVKPIVNGDTIEFDLNPTITYIANESKHYPFALNSFPDYSKFEICRSLKIQSGVPVAIASSPNEKSGNTLLALITVSVIETEETDKSIKLFDENDERNVRADIEHRLLEFSALDLITIAEENGFAVDDVWSGSIPSELVQILFDDKRGKVVGGSSGSKIGEELVTVKRGMEVLYPEAWQFSINNSSGHEKLLVEPSYGDLTFLNNSLSCFVPKNLNNFLIPLCVKCQSTSYLQGWSHIPYQIDVKGIHKKGLVKMPVINYLNTGYNTSLPDGKVVLTGRFISNVHTTSNAQSNDMSQSFNKVVLSLLKCSRTD